MKLFHAPTSPFVRKVLIVAHELGLSGDIALIPTDPWQSDRTLTEQNPLSQIPALVIDDGSVLYDSPVICEYLDHRGGSRLFPLAGPRRWAALRRQALGDGLATAAVIRRIETTLRPEAYRSPDYVARQQAVMRRSLDALEHDAPILAREAIDIGHCAAAAALGYVDFRFGNDDWRAGRPALSDWFAEFSKRPSMQATAMPKP